MVKLPSRSKGCNTCRKRKKGCDLQKPTCLRCARDGFECLGYDRPTQWVQYEPRQHFERPRSKSSSPESEIEILPAAMQKQQLQIGIVDSFLNEYMPDRAALSLDEQKPWSFQWRKQLSQLSQMHPLLKQVTAALGMSCMSGQVGDRTLALQGRKLYGKALQALNQALQVSPTDASTFDANVVIVVLLMGLFEQFNGFSSDSGLFKGRGWIVHTQGMRRLIELQGPEAFIPDGAFDIFQVCQVMQFTSAVVVRKGSPLASPKWRFIPWFGRAKDSRDRFFDIVYPLAGYMDLADTWSMDDGHLPVIGLLESLGILQTNLDLWRCALEDQFYDGCGELLRSISRTEFDIAGNGGMDIEAGNFHHANLNTILLYCATQIHILVLAHNLHKRLSPGESDANPSLGIWRAYPLAQWIVSAIPMAVRDGGILGAQAVLFPAGAVRWLIFPYREVDSDAARVLEVKLAHAVKEVGYMAYLKDFLSSMQSMRQNVAYEWSRRQSPR